MTMAIVIVVLTIATTVLVSPNIIFNNIIVIIILIIIIIIAFDHYHQFLLSKKISALDPENPHSEAWKDLRLDQQPTVLATT